MQTTLDRPAAPTLLEPVLPQSEQDTDTLVVDVTWDDIRNGERGHGRMCAIALAARRQLDPSLTYAMISELHVYSCDVPGVHKRYDSEAAWLWAVAFDTGLPVKPETFVFRRRLVES